MYALLGLAFAGSEGVGPAGVPTVAATDAVPLVPVAAVPVLLDKVVAVVNEDVILLSEVYAFDTYIDEEGAAGPEARARAERDVVERILQQRLVQQEVVRLNLSVTDQEVDRSIDDIAQRNGLDRDGLRAEVEKEMTWGLYREELRKGLEEMKFGQSVLRPRISISEDELRDAWIRLNQDRPQVAKVQAFFLAWPTDGNQDALRAKVQALIVEAQGDFVAVATAHDQGPFGAQGGEMGSFKPGELVGALDTALQATATGSISAPVETPQGIFVLKVVSRVAESGDFESARPMLEQQIFESRMEAEEERWFEQARRQATIRVLI